MQVRNLKSSVGATVAICCAMAMTGQSASAAQFYSGWNYSIDSFNDGSGGAVYEIKGLAIKETANSLIVALTGGTPLAGQVDSGARGGSIGFGDLFFNFSGKDFKTASQQKLLYGVRFAPANDSLVTGTGVFSQVSAVSVSQANYGFSSLNHYYSSGFDRVNTQGDDIKTKQDAYNYYGQYDPILNVIGSGTKVGDITMLTGSQLASEGLNFGHFNAVGTHTIGFQFDKSFLPTGDYLANLFLECGNDGVAIKANVSSAAVPEPTTMVGLALAGAGLGVARSRKRRQQAAG
ncbi:MAG: PEP-CTERM sorting domain-containing protein [Cyanobacteria bacterium]|nr:PEP-CTERM sorting domain-containing protein [Cyanobacteriota bacterium]MDW8202720.1 XDD3 domain-containing surface protein [Cyanobacteriota bacterium SKYGB_h_bin112]